MAKDPDAENGNHDAGNEEGDGDTTVNVDEGHGR